MKVIQVSAGCHHDCIGGTERFQRDLIRHLERRQVAGALLWLTEGDSPGPHGEPTRLSQGSEDVRVLPLPSGGTAPEFERDASSLLAAERPSMLHFHTFGPREARLAQLAVDRGLPYAFTYHGPIGLCPNGTLLRWGATPCDGEIRPRRCGVCRTVSWLRTPHPARGRALALVDNLRSGLRRRRKLRGYPGVGSLRRMVRTFLASSDPIFVPTPRFTSVLTANGAREDVIHFCPPGVSRDATGASPSAQQPAPGAAPAPCVVGYVGRIDPPKGLHVLLEAFMETTWRGARLRVIGEADDTPRATAYARELHDVARRDPRVSFTGAKPVGALGPIYDGLSMVAIPSVGLETGPLVLLEALHEGVFPLVSARVGQLALARKHGCVVEPNTPSRWTRALEHHFDRFRAREAPFDGTGAGAPPELRTMDEVADDVLRGYGDLVPPAATAAVG